MTTLLVSDWWRAGHVTTLLVSDWWRAGHVTTLLVSDWSLSSSPGLFQSPVLFMIPISASDTSAPCRLASRASNDESTYYSK